MIEDIKYKLNLLNSEKPSGRPQASVLIAILNYGKYIESPELIYTQRSSHLSTHSGEVSFPGGKVEISDLNLKETALRETFEEVGILKKEIQVIREITEVYIPPSNFSVTPFIGILNYKPVLKLNSEVAKIIEVPFSDLLDDNNIASISITNSYMKDTTVPCFNIDGSIIWGATAMMLSEIKELLKNMKP